MKVKIILALCLFLLPAAAREVGYHNLFLMPTAYTMPKGQGYFTDAQLLLLNGGVSVTNSTHISAFSVFPIIPELLQSFSVGVKQNYLKTNHVEAAVWGTYTFVAQMFSVGNVMSLGNKTRGLHLGIGYWGIADEDYVDNIIIHAGAKYKRFMIEYMNTTSPGYFDEEFKGLLTIGVRFCSGRVSWDLGGIRPLAAFGELSWFAFPYVKASVYF